MRDREALLGVLVGTMIACGHAESPRPPDLAEAGAAGLRAMRAEAIEANTTYLSSDELEGRAPGTEGGRKAEEYIAARFRELGLAPGGEHGTYFQTVPLRRGTLVDGSLIVHARGGDVAIDPATDVVIRPYTHQADVAIDAPLVFVGFGISRPELGYDDLAGVDLHGAVAVAFAGSPRTIGGKEAGSALHAVLSDSQLKARALRDHGAAAVLFVYDPIRAKEMPWATFRTKVPRFTMDWLAHGVAGSGYAIPVEIFDETVLGRLLPDGAPRADELFARVDRGEPVHLDLGVTASLRVHTELHDLTARNVAAVLPGGDPALAGEYVVYTAHHDHLGIGEPVDGDAIYNGALDDALGVAGMIEIARAFAALPHKPRRSMLFLAVTGEESGLLGSDYFAERPTVGAGHVIADVNIDSLPAIRESFDVVALGADHSSLAADVDAAARASGYAISPDPEPEQVFFIRSDQYSFVKRGVPSLFPSSGLRDAHGDTAANKALEDAWSKDHYHQPSDVWRPEYKAAWAAKEAAFDFLLGLSIANDDARPRWNPGDPFGR